MSHPPTGLVNEVDSKLNLAANYSAKKEDIHQIRCGISAAKIALNETAHTHISNELSKFENNLALPIVTKTEVLIIATELSKFIETIQGTAKKLVAIIEISNGDQTLAQINDSSRTYLEKSNMVIAKLMVALNIINSLK